MTPALAALVALLGATVTAGVTWALGHKRSEADSDNVAVATAEKLVGLLRADMLEMRANVDRVRAELDAVRVHVGTCEHDNAALRAEIAQLRAENAGLRARVDDLETKLHRTNGDGR